MIGARSTHARQRGMVLITALLLLVVVTILAVSLFHSFGLDEKIAGNMREKSRALQAAETAEESAEAWLASGNATLPVTCAAGPPVSYTVGEVCTTATALANPASLPWPTGVSYTPTGISLTGAQSYYATPMYYITYLGPAPSGTGSIYQIDAAGYGGNPSSAAVVETTYLVQAGVQCRGGCNP
jgi:type IV pilus assembly protein PilX